MAGCGKSSDNNKKENVAACDSDAITIAVQPTLESLPLMVAKEEGLFDSCGVKVCLKNYASQVDCDTAMIKNIADAMITDIVRAAFWEKENKKKLNMATWTNTHYMLISSKKSRVKELSQMTDRIMAVTRFSVTDMLADSAITRAGKQPDEMFKVQINNQEIRLNMLIENKIDAAFLQHPYAAEALSKGGHVIMHGGKSRSGVLAFNTTVDSTDVNNVLKAYDQACDKLNKKGVVSYAPIVEKYIRKDITKWAKHIGEVKFRHSAPIEPDAVSGVKAWLKDN